MEGPWTLYTLIPWRWRGAVLSGELVFSGAWGSSPVLALASVSIPPFCGAFQSAPHPTTTTTSPPPNREVELMLCSRVPWDL